MSYFGGITINNYHIAIQSFLNAIEDQAIMVDKNGHIKYTNQAWDSFWMKNEYDLVTTSIGSDYIEMLKNTGNDVAWNGITNVLNKNIEEFTMVYPLHTNTKERWFYMIARRCLLDATSEGLLILHRNITKEYISELEVIDVLENMTDAFFSLDEEWNITHLNRVAHKLLKNDELLGKNLWMEFPEAIDTDFYHHYLISMNEKRNTSFEAYFPPLLTWFDVHVYPKAEGGISVYFKNINDRKETELKMQQYAYFDDLTSLPNRRSMNARIEEAISNDVHCAIFYIDIDGFKNINDLYGHEKGDALLEKVGAKLYKVVSKIGTLGRLGGDEFIIFTQEKSRFELENLANEISSIFSKPFVIDSHYSFSISVSMGISRYPQDASSLTQLLSAADTAMYRSKRERGNHFQFYQVNMTEELSRRLDIEHSLSEDLREKGLYFVLQPQIDSKSNEMIGFEVLSRWEHPTLGKLSPLEFIEIAEETGNILKLTHFLMAEVFSKVSYWIKNYQFTKKVSINVTPYLLAQKSFFQDLFDLLIRFEIPFHQVELEVTENSQLVSSSSMLDNMKECRDRGIHIAIDDFGTGFSMLSSLTHFPVNKIKIDKYFIQRIGKDAQTEAILKSIISLSTNLHCDLVAEGVEHLEDVQFLEKLGCTLFQGKYYEEPLDMDDFEEKYILTCF